MAEMIGWFNGRPVYAISGAGGGGGGGGDGGGDSDAGAVDPSAGGPMGPGEGEGAGRGGGGNPEPAGADPTAGGPLGPGPGEVGRGRPGAEAAPSPEPDSPVLDPRDYSPLIDTTMTTRLRPRPRPTSRGRHRPLRAGSAPSAVARWPPRPWPLQPGQHEPGVPGGAVHSGDRGVPRHRGRTYRHRGRRSLGFASPVPGGAKAGSRAGRAHRARHRGPDGPGPHPRDGPRGVTDRQRRGHVGRHGHGERRRRAA